MQKYQIWADSPSHEMFVASSDAEISANRNSGRVFVSEHESEAEAYSEIKRLAEHCRNEGRYCYWHNPNES